MFGKKKPLDPSADWTKTGSFMHKPSRGWLHSDDSLMEGGVCYAVRYVGCLQVLKSMRTLQYDLRQQVTREAILRCSEAAGYQTGKRKKIAKNLLKLLGELPHMANSGCSVNMTVSSLGIKLTSIENGRIIANHDMQGISFASGGEKDCIDMVGYVAKDSANGRACHVVDCGGGLAYDVINTIGQAFEIRFKMFLQNPPLATEVPERFSETLFEENEDHTYELEYDEPRNDVAHGKPKASHTESVISLVQIVSNSSGGYETPMNAGAAAGYQALRGTTAGGISDYEDPSNMTSAALGYDVPKTSLSGYDVPKTQPEQSVLDDYDNPFGPHPNTFGSSNGITSQTNSLAFAAGAQYENPVSGGANMAFYENPLAAPRPPAREDSLDRNQADLLLDLSLYDNPLNPSGDEPERTNWATFDDELPPPPPPMATNPGSQDYVTPQEPAKKAPPKPIPYALSKSEKERNEAAERVNELDQSTNSVHAEVWFHGPMSRAEAELLLEDEGDFLVRESKSKAGQYVLSGVQNGQPRHLLLVDPEGKVRTKDREFSSVQELVGYHMRNKLPIISSGSEVTISHPVLRQ